MRYLSAISNEQCRDILEGSNDILTLYGVVVDESFFDLSYLSVDGILTNLLKDIPYILRYDDSALDTLIELNYDSVTSDSRVDLALTGNEISEILVAYYGIYQLDFGYKLYRYSSDRCKYKSLFNKEYDGDWYHSIWLDKKRGIKCVKAKWSGVHPNLCDGIWYLAVDGDDMSDKIPDRYSQMCTYITIIDSNYCESYGCLNNFNSCDGCKGYYSCGMKCNEWIEYNIDWLKRISMDSEVHNKIYDAINEHDFIAGTCGGCL